MCGGGCFSSVKTKLCSEEELKNGGKSEEMEEGATADRLRCLFMLVRYLLVVGGVVTFDPGTVGPQQQCRL